MSNIGQGSNESTLDQEAALNKKQKKTISQGDKGSVAAQAGVVSPESAVAVKKSRRKTVADEALQGDALVDSGAVVSDVDASALSDGGSWQLAQAETGAVLPGLGGAGGAAAGAGSAAAAGGAAAAGAAGAAGAGAAMGAGAATAAGLGLGTVAAATAGVAGVAAAAGGKSSSPAPAAPPVPTIAVVSGDDRVNSSENTAGVTISGTTVAGATVKIYDGETLLATVVADGGGAFSYANVHFTASAGTTHNFTATATTATGESVRTAVHAVQVDTVAPTGITGAIVHNGTYDTGASASDNLTSNTRPQIEGTVEANASVSVQVGVQTLTAVADSNGRYVVTPAALASGAYTPVITVTDAAGNSTTVNGTAFTVDAASPANPAASISHDALNDTGASASDNVTSNTTPLIVGTAEAGSAVRVVVSGQTLNTVADVNGNFSVTPTALAAGVHTPVVTATDLAGNATTANGTAFTVGVALGAPTISTVSGDDLVNASENTAGVAISGSAARLSTVNVYDGATLLGTTTADGSGYYTLSLSANRFSASAGATHNLTATATNNVGTSAASAIHAIQVDTVAPTGISGSIVHNSTYDTGPSATDNFTGNNRPQIEGQVEANASVSVLVGGQTLTATANGAGYFVVRPATGLADMQHTPVITVTDAAGNSSTANGTAFTVSTGIPAAATGVSILHSPSNDTGALSSDSITKNTTPDIVGNARAGATVTVSIGSGAGAQTMTTVADSYGHFVVTPTALAPGNYTPLVTVTDASGNVSSVATGTAFTVDVGPPAAPAGTLAHTVSNDAGLSHSDDLTNVATPVITVTADAGSHVTVSVAGQTLTATESTPGNFTVTTSPLVSGVYTPVITAVDAAGNSTTRNGTPFEVDTIAPNVPTGHIEHDLENDTGLSQGDSITSNTAPVISGQAEAFARVTVSVAGQELTTTADEFGFYSVPVEEALESGSYTPVITVTDDAGNSTTVNGTQFTVEAAPAATTALFVATNHTLEHPTALIQGQSDVDVCADGGLTVIFEGQTYEQGSLDLFVDESGKWTLDVSAQVLAQNLSDGHYDVTAVASNAAGGITETTMTDVLWLLDGCQNFVAGQMNPEDHHWSIGGEPGIETLGVDFGFYVTSLGGVEVTNYESSEFNFDAQDVTLAECGIDVTQGAATFFSNNITLDGGNITVADTAARHLNPEDDVLHAGVTLVANGSIEMYGYGDTGGIDILSQNSGNGGLITLNESNAGWNGTFYGADVLAGDAGIYLSANDSIAITVDGHTTAGVTLSQNYIGQGEDANVYVDNAHIALLAGSGLSLLETYVDVVESGTYTLVDNGITRFETAQSTVYGNSGLDVSLLQDHLDADLLLDASDAGITLAAGWVIAGSVSLVQETLAGDSVYLDNANISILGSGVSLMDTIETSYSDITGADSFVSHQSSYWDSGDVGISQNHVTAYNGAIDASDAQISVSGFYVGVGDVGVEQYQLHATDGIDIGNAQATIYSAVRFDLGSGEISDYHTSYEANGDQHLITGGEASFWASDVYVYQDGITADHGDVYAVNASAVRDVSLEGSFFVPMQGDVVVEQYNLTAYDGSVDMSNANAYAFAVDQSLWYSNSDVIGVFDSYSVSDSSVHDHEVTNDFINSTVDVTRSELFAVGSSVAVDQRYISAGQGDVVANNAQASLVIQHNYNNGNFPFVFGGDVSVDQRYMTAVNADGGSVNLNNASASLWSEENFALVRMTVTSDVSYTEVLIETVGDVTSGNVDSSTHDYETSSDVINFGSVNLEQSSIRATGSINAVDALVDIHVGGLIASDLYISQDYMTAGGGINLQGAHLTVYADNNISLVDSVVSIWEYTYDSSTIFEGAVTTNAVTLEDFYQTNVDSAYIEQYELHAELGNVNISDANLAMHAGGDISADDVWIYQSQVTAIEGSIDANAASLNLSVDNYGRILVNAEVDIFQHAIIAGHGTIDASGANILLAGGANSYISADSVYVSQSIVSAGGDIDLSDARVNASVGDGGYVDVPYDAFVRQHFISAGGHLDAAGAQVNINVGSDEDYNAGVYSNDMFVSQQQLTADDRMWIDNAAVRVQGGNGADIEIDGRAFISQSDNYAGSDSRLDAGYGHVTLAAGNNSDISATDVFIDQNNMEAGRVGMGHASVMVSVGDNAQISLFSEAYIEQYSITAYNGNISASDASVTLAAGNNSDISADNVYVTQTDLIASGDIRMRDIRAVVSAADGGYIDVPGAVYVQQTNISAGGVWDAGGAEADIYVGFDYDQGAQIYTDRVFVVQEFITADGWMNIDNAGVNVEGRDGAYIDINGDAYLVQHQISANELNEPNGGLYGAFGHVTVRGGDGALVTADDVYIYQNNLTGNWADIGNATVKVRVYDNAHISLDGSAYIEQSWISAYDRNNGWPNFISANDVSVEVYAGYNADISADYVYVSQTDFTAGDFISMENVHVTVTAGDGGYVNVPGSISVEQFRMDAGSFIDASGAQVFVAVGSDTTAYSARIYTDGAYVSQTAMFAADDVSVELAGVNVQGGDGAVVELDGSAFVVQRNIYANVGHNGYGGVQAGDAYVTVAAGNDAYVTANDVFINQNNMYGDWVDVSAASVFVDVVDNSQINLDTGAYIDQSVLRARNGDVQGEDATIRITGGTDSLITIDSELIRNDFSTAYTWWPRHDYDGDFPWHSGLDKVATTAWTDTNGRYEGANVFIDQHAISAAGGVDLTGAAIVIGVDGITPNTPSLPVNLDIELKGVAVTIDQRSNYAGDLDVDLSAAHVNLQTGDLSRIVVTPQTTQNGTDHSSLYADWWGISVGGYDAYYTYVTNRVVYNTYAENNNIGVFQIGNYADNSVWANDVAVRIAAGDDSYITLDATSVLVDQAQLHAATGDVHATAASVTIAIGNDSELRMTPERDGYSHATELFTVSEYVDWQHWHYYEVRFLEDRTSWENSYGDVAVWQNHMTADGSVNVDGANVQISGGDGADISLVGISVDVQQSWLSAEYGDVTARNAVVNINAGDNSGVTLVAAWEENFSMSSNYYLNNNSDGYYTALPGGGWDTHHDFTWAEQVGGSGQISHWYSEQRFDVKVDQSYLSAQDGNVYADGAAVEFSVGDHAQISLHGADVYVEQYAFHADGGDVNVSNSRVAMTGGANSRIEVERGQANLWEQHESGWFQSWTPEAFVTSYTYAGDISVHQSYIYAQEALSGNAHDVTTGGTAYLNDVSVQLSVGDASAWGSWISAHDVLVTQTNVKADENLYAVNASVSIVAGSGAFVEVQSAEVLQYNMTAGDVLRSKLVGDYFSGNLTNDNGNSDLGVDYWGTLDLSGAHVNLAAGANISAYQAIIGQSELTAGETVDLSSATIDISGRYVSVDQVVISQQNVSAGGVQYYFDDTGIEGYSRYQLDQLNTLTVVDPLEFIPTTILGLVDLADASIDITADYNFHSDVVAIERKNIESGKVVDMQNNRIDISAADMTIGDVHNWLGVDGYYAGPNYDNNVAGVSAATFDFNDNAIWLSAWNGDIHVNNYVEEYRYVTGSVVQSDDNYVGLTAWGDIYVGSSVGIGNEVVAPTYNVPVEVNMNSGAVEIVARGDVDVNDVYIGVYAGNDTTLDLSMNDNRIYISADSVYGGDLYNVDVGAQLAAGSSVNHNSVEVYAYTRDGGYMEFSNVYLSGTDASATFWGNDISIGSMAVENRFDSQISFGAEYLTLFADSAMNIDLIDLSSQDVGSYNYPSKDNWWWAEATIGSNSTLIVDQLKLDGAQAFLEFNVNSGSQVHYDISVDQLGIGQNNGDLAYRNHGGSAMKEFAYDSMTHDYSEQFDLIDLSDLGITSVDQITGSVTLGSGFATGLVQNIHFELITPTGTNLGAGSTVVFDLQNVRLESNARHDYYSETGLGNNGSVDATDVWYAFWNYSLHLAPVGG